VLDVQGDKALLITKDVTHNYMTYNNSFTNVTWETCTLRKRLNERFLHTFSEQEQSRIALTTIINEDNQWYGTSGGNNTQDRIFLLSIAEADKYFGNSGDYYNNRRKEYCDGKFLPVINDEFLLITNGLFLSNDHDQARNANYGGSTAWWWLRSPGGMNYRVASVFVRGVVSIFGDSVNNVSSNGGVRAALWLNL
jgi:hypothetical protein